MGWKRQFSWFVAAFPDIQCHTLNWFIDRLTIQISNFIFKYTFFEPNLTNPDRAYVGFWRLRKKFWWKKVRFEKSSLQSQRGYGITVTNCKYNIPSLFSFFTFCYHAICRLTVPVNCNNEVIFFLLCNMFIKYSPKKWNLRKKLNRPDNNSRLCSLLDWHWCKLNGSYAHTYSSISTIYKDGLEPIIVLKWKSLKK